MTWRKGEDFAAETGPTRRLLKGLARRLVVTLTSAVKWQVLGQKGGQGGDETADLEVFSGIGFYSRPRTSSNGGNPEAVSVAIGGPKTSVIVATRDEATRKLGAGDLADDETCVYNSTARIIVKANGTVEIRLHGGVAVALATKADVQALRDYVYMQFKATGGHTHAVSGGATTTVASIAGSPPPVDPNPPTAIPPSPTGTSVLKGQ